LRGGGAVAGRGRGGGGGGGPGGRSPPNTTPPPPPPPPPTTAFLVQGEGKRAILDRILSGDDSVPAGRLRPQGDLFFMVDKAAAGRWAGSGQTS